MIYIMKMKKFLLGLLVCVMAVTGMVEASFPAYADTVETSELKTVYWTYDYGNGWSAETKDNHFVLSPTGSYATAIWIELQNKPKYVDGDIFYQVNLSGSGWLNWQKGAAEAGDIAGSMPLEAVKIRLTGELEEQYDIYYSVFQNGAWTELVKNGETAGVEAQGLRVDGLRVAIRKKGAGAPIDPWYEEHNLDPSKPMVALTYDDGPAPSTRSILDTLEAYGMKATFYMVGNRMENYPDTVRRVAALGCEIGSHTWGHNYITGLGASSLHSNLNQFDSTLQNLVGIRTATMRPPGGFVNNVSLQALASYGVPAIMWSIDTMDWKSRNAQAVVESVLSQVKDGDIVLMHDLYGSTAEATAILVPELINRGYQLVTVSELARCRGCIQAGQVYHAFHK